MSSVGALKIPLLPLVNTFTRYLEYKLFCDSKNYNSNLSSQYLFFILL